MKLYANSTACPPYTVGEWAGFRGHYCRRKVFSTAKSTKNCGPCCQSMHCQLRKIGVDGENGGERPARASLLPNLWAGCGIEPYRRRHLYVNRNDSKATGPLGSEILGRLLDEHAAALVLFARQFCCCPEDAVQEAFVELVRQSEMPREVLPWLYRVVRNKAYSASRAQGRRERREAAVAQTRSAALVGMTRDGLDAQTAAARLGTATVGTTRSGRGPPVGWPDVSAGWPTVGHVGQHCLSALPGGTGHFAKEPRNL